MKPYLLLFLFLAISCKKESEQEPQSAPASQEQIQEEAPVLKSPLENERFRSVTVAKLENDSVAVSGEARVFEANFGWVIEDGHNEIASGSKTTTAGAPAWGEFHLTVSSKKQRPNSTLTLILFESSAKDGSRQHPLPIALP